MLLESLTKLWQLVTKNIQTKWTEHSKEINSWLMYNKELLEYRTKLLAYESEDLGSNPGFATTVTKKGLRANGSLFFLAVGQSSALPW